MVERQSKKLAASVRFRSSRIKSRKKGNLISETFLLFYDERLSAFKDFVYSYCFFRMIDVGNGIEIHENGFKCG